MATRQLRSKRSRLPFFQFVSIRFESLLAALNALFAPAKEHQTQSTTLSLQQRYPILSEAMVAQTRASLFKAYDLRRNKLHTVEGSGGKPAPRKTSIHRLTRSDWATPKVTKASRKSPRKSTKKTVKAASSLTAANLLRCENDETSCLHCDRPADDPACTSKCYTAFRKKHDAEKLIVRNPASSMHLRDHANSPQEIKGPGKHGYGAFTKPGASLKKGQWLGEYVGQLMPVDLCTTSLYRFEIPGVCAIDAEPCGNWTRFVNSSCVPNVSAWTDTIGKRHAVFFQAMRDIGPEEELTFNYGKSYFSAAGFQCDCPAMKRPHAPGEAKAKAKAKAKK